MRKSGIPFWVGTYAATLIILLGGCRPMVGGPCSYEQHAGIAEVISANEDGYHLRFTLLPALGVDSRSKIPLERLNGDIFEEDKSHPKLAGAVVGSRFYTEASVIIEGSCTPFNFNIGAPVL